MIALALLTCGAPRPSAPASSAPIVVVPAGRPGPMPLVVAYHGNGGRPENLVAVWGPVARREGFVLIAPRVPDAESWFIDRRPGMPLEQQFDLTRFDALVDDALARHPIDPDRVYVVGFSLGGMYTHQLACDRSERIAGFGVVGTTLERSQLEHCGGQPRPMMHIQGTEDGWDGLERTDRGLVGRYVSVAEHLAFWAGRNGCAPGEAVALPDTVADGTRSTRQDHVCATAPLRAIRVDGGGHFWPGMDIQRPGAARDFSAAEALWSFFVESR